MTQTTVRKNNITGAASHRILIASPSSVSYRLPDSRFDVTGHQSEWACLVDCHTITAYTMMKNPLKV